MPDDGRKRIRPFASRTARYGAQHDTTLRPPGPGPRSRHRGEPTRTRLDRRRCRPGSRARRRGQLSSPSGLPTSFVGNPLGSKIGGGGRGAVRLATPRRPGP
jgi:hypothetical protein